MKRHVLDVIVEKWKTNHSMFRKISDDVREGNVGGCVRVLVRHFSRRWHGRRAKRR